MPNILLVVASYLPERIDGTVLSTRELARSYVKAGHNVVIACREMGEISAYHPVADTFLPTIRLDQVEGLTVARLCVRLEHDYIDSIDHPDVPQLFSELLEKFHIEAVHIHHIEHLSTQLPFICEEKRIPCVFTLHDFYSACPTVQLVTNGGRLCVGPDGGVNCASCKPAMHKVVLPGPGLVRIRRAAHLLLRRNLGRFKERHLLMQRLLQSSVQLVSPSQYLADTMVTATKLPLTIPVIRNGVLPSMNPKRSRPSSAPVIGYMGILGASKGLHLLTKALQSLTDQPWRLEIHGRGDLRFGHACKAMLPNDRATLNGGYLPDHYHQILAGLDLLVVPSIWPENCPLVILQALAAGVPCVVAGWGGMAELVSDGVNGLHFKPGDAQSLSRIIASLLMDHVRWEQLASGAESTALESWDAVASRYLSLLLPESPRMP